MPTHHERSTVSLPAVTQTASRSTALHQQHRHRHTSSSVANRHHSRHLSTSFLAATATTTTTTTGTTTGTATTASSSNSSSQQRSSSLLAALIAVLEPGGDGAAVACGVADADTAAPASTLPSSGRPWLRLARLLNTFEKDVVHACQSTTRGNLTTRGKSQGAAATAAAAGYRSASSTTIGYGLHTTTISSASAADAAIAAGASRYVTMPAFHMGSDGDEGGANDSFSLSWKSPVRQARRGSSGSQLQAAAAAAAASARSKGLAAANATAAGDLGDAPPTPNSSSDADQQHRSRESFSLQSSSQPATGGRSSRQSLGITATTTTTTTTASNGRRNSLLHKSAAPSDLTLKDTSDTPFLRAIKHLETRRSSLGGFHYRNNQPKARLGAHQHTHPRPSTVTNARETRGLVAAHRLGCIPLSSHAATPSSASGSANTSTTAPQPHQSYSSRRRSSFQDSNDTSPRLSVSSTNATAPAGAAGSSVVTVNSGRASTSVAAATTPTVTPHPQDSAAAASRVAASSITTAAAAAVAEPTLGSLGITLPLLVALAAVVSYLPPTVTMVTVTVSPSPSARATSRSSSSSSPPHYVPLSESEVNACVTVKHRICRIFSLLLSNGALEEVLAQPWVVAAMISMVPVNPPSATYVEDRPLAAPSSPSLLQQQQQQHHQNALMASTGGTVDGGSSPVNGSFGSRKDGAAVGGMIGGSPPGSHSALHHLPRPVSSFSNIHLVDGSLSSISSVGSSRGGRGGSINTRGRLGPTTASSSGAAMAGAAGTTAPLPTAATVARGAAVRPSPYSRVESLEMLGMLLCRAHQGSGGWWGDTSARHLATTNTAFHHESVDEEEEQAATEGEGGEDDMADDEGGGGRRGEHKTPSSPSPAAAPRPPTLGGFTLQMHRGSSCSASDGSANYYTRLVSSLRTAAVAAASMEMPLMTTTAAGVGAGTRLTSRTTGSPLASTTLNYSNTCSYNNTAPTAPHSQQHHPHPSKVTKSSKTAKRAAQPLQRQLMGWRLVGSSVLGSGPLLRALLSSSQLMLRAILHIPASSSRRPPFKETCVGLLLPGCFSTSLQCAQESWRTFAAIVGSIDCYPPGVDSQNGDDDAVLVEEHDSHRRRAALMDEEDDEDEAEVEAALGARLHSSMHWSRLFWYHFMENLTENLFLPVLQEMAAETKAGSAAAPPTSTNTPAQGAVWTSRVVVTCTLRRFFTDYSLYELRARYVRSPALLAAILQALHRQVSDLHQQLIGLAKYMTEQIVAYAAATAAAVAANDGHQHHYHTYHSDEDDMYVNKRRRRSSSPLFTGMLGVEAAPGGHTGAADSPPASRNGNNTTHVLMIRRFLVNTRHHRRLLLRLHRLLYEVVMAPPPKPPVLQHLLCSNFTALVTVVKQLHDVLRLQPLVLAHQWLIERGLPAGLLAPSDEDGSSSQARPRGEKPISAREEDDDDEDDEESGLPLYLDAVRIEEDAVLQALGMGRRTRRSSSRGGSLLFGSHPHQAQHSVATTNSAATLPVNRRKPQGIAPFSTSLLRWDDSETDLPTVTADTLGAEPTGGGWWNRPAAAAATNINASASLDYTSSSLLTAESPSAGSAWHHLDVVEGAGGGSPSSSYPPPHQRGSSVLPAGGTTRSSGLAAAPAPTPTTGRGAEGVEDATAAEWWAWRRRSKKTTIASQQGGWRVDDLLGADSCFLSWGTPSRAAPNIPRGSSFADPSSFFSPSSFVDEDERGWWHESCGMLRCLEALMALREQPPPPPSPPQQVHHLHHRTGQAVV